MDSREETDGEAVGINEGLKGSGQLAARARGGALDTRFPLVGRLEVARWLTGAVIMTDGEDKERMYGRRTVRKGMRLERVWLVVRGWEK